MGGRQASDGASVATARSQATHPLCHTDFELKPLEHNMRTGWINPGLLRDFQSEGTDAHRLCTAEDGWVERFGGDVLISFKRAFARDRLLEELQTWAESVGFAVQRVFARFIPTKNEHREPPLLLIGDPSESKQTIAIERYLRFGIDFGTGYSPGLFLDQRENRRYVRHIAPKRVLNCFAYTCSFSVYAACSGASTINIDVSKRYLTRGRENFALNNLSTRDHRFITDDVQSVLPRLARRGEKFDAIILDPPTFSRSPEGRKFQVQQDFENLLISGIAVAHRAAYILVSTNCSALGERALKVMARYCLKQTRRVAAFHPGLPLADFPQGTGASTVWLALR